MSMRESSHPGTTEVRGEFEDVGGKTRVVLTHAGIPTDSPGAAGWNRAPSVQGPEQFAAFLDAGMGDIDPTMDEAGSG